MRLSQPSALPWYKEFWPWFLLSVLATAVILCSIFIYFAVTGEDSLVDDNYYKDGLAINQELEADKAAASQSITANVLVTHLDRIEVRLHSNTDVHPPFLKLKIIHPTLDGRDQFINLFLLPNGSYSSALEKPLNEGRWHFHLMSNDDSWRVKGIVILPNTDIQVISPQI